MTNNEKFYIVTTGPNTGKIGKLVCDITGYTQFITLLFNDGKFAVYTPNSLCEVEFTTLRSDRRKHPAQYAYRVLTNAEAASLAQGAHVPCLDQHGRLGEVKITSVKTWKTRPGYADVHWKYGLYEYGIESICPTSAQDFFVELVRDPTLEV